MMSPSDQDALTRATLAGVGNVERLFDDTYRGLRCVAFLGDHPNAGVAIVAASLLPAAHPVAGLAASHPVLQEVVRTAGPDWLVATSAEGGDLLAPPSDAPGSWWLGRLWFDAGANARARALTRATQRLVDLVAALERFGEQTMADPGRVLHAASLDVRLWGMSRVVPVIDQTIPGWWPRYHESPDAANTAASR